MVHNRSMRGEKLLLVLYLCQKFKETAAVVVGFAVRKAQVGMLRMYVERGRGRCVSLELVCNLGVVAAAVFAQPSVCGR